MFNRIGLLAGASARAGTSTKKHPNRTRCAMGTTLLTVSLAVSTTANAAASCPEIPVTATVYGTVSTRCLTREMVTDPYPWCYWCLNCPGALNGAPFKDLVHIPDDTYCGCNHTNYVDHTSAFQCRYESSSSWRTIDRPVEHRPMATVSHARCPNRDSACDLGTIPGSLLETGCPSADTLDVTYWFSVLDDSPHVQCALSPSSNGTDSASPAARILCWVSVGDCGPPTTTTTVSEGVSTTTTTLPGACPEEPATDCVESEAAVLKASRWPSGDLDLTLQASFHGALSSVLDVQSLLNGSGDAQVCLYDSQSGDARLRSSAEAPGGSAWKEKNSRALVFRASTANGVRTVAFRVRRRGELSLRLAARALSDHGGFPTDTVFVQNPSIEVHLRSGSSCVAARLRTPAESNNAAGFIDRE